MKTISAHLPQYLFMLMLTIVFENASVAQTSAPGTDVRQDQSSDQEIREGFYQINEVLATKDLETVMSMYDDSEDIVVIGSDSGEVFIGRDRVKVFMKMIVSMPFVFSFEMDTPTIHHHQNIAWVFSDGKMVHTRSSGKVSKVPYRITAVLVKKGNKWKWKMFSGSIPRSE
jgi:ketosteroid isomerase-like protein